MEASTRRAPEDTAASLGTYLNNLATDPSRAASGARRIAAELSEASPRLNSPDFEEISSRDLWLLFHEYDRHFFGGQLADCLGSSPREHLGLRLSSRMTSAGGKALHYRGSSPARFEIVVSSHLLFTNFAPGEEPVRINGLRCHSRLDAL